MNDAWAQRGDDIESADREDERRAEYAEKCRIACEWLPDGAIDGGWTAAGMSAYAKKLEGEIAQLRLAEEGVKEAFGHVVQQKHDLDAECSRLRALLKSAYDVIMDENLAKTAERERILDGIDDCPGLTMEQDRWLRK